MTSTEFNWREQDTSDHTIVSESINVIRSRYMSSFVKELMFFDYA